MESSKQHTILVVDDELIVARALSALVRSFGHGVELADSVDSAIDRLSQNKFDVVITDVRMGSSHGFDLLRHVQTHAPSVPVVLITGEASTDAAMAAIQAGAYDYLSKPPRRDELAAVLNRAIERKSMVEEVERLRRGDISSARLTDVAGRSLISKSEGWPSLDEMVEGYVMRVLEHTQGNVSKAALILGISRRTLQRKGWKRDERDMSPMT
jgi:DNA-binding NtrC family response regulator